MRVITGKYKGKKLETPEGKGVRPTSDLVKEAIYDIIMNDVYGNVFCDLFSGTGGLGIEAISRGAEKCYFCDNDRSSIRLIKTNLAKVGIDDEAVVIQGDYKKCLRRIHEKIDVFLIDPPYEAALYDDVVSDIDSLDLLNDDGIIIIEHDTRDKLPSSYGSIELIKERKYGKTSISIYARKG